MNKAQARHGAEDIYNISVFRWQSSIICLCMTYCQAAILFEQAYVTMLDGE